MLGENGARGTCGGACDKHRGGNGDLSEHFPHGASFPIAGSSSGDSEYRL